VYWTVPGHYVGNAYDETGSIRTAPKAGGAPITLAAGQHLPRSVTLEETAVYWVDASARTVMKVAKP